MTSVVFSCADALALSAPASCGAAGGSNAAFRAPAPLSEARRVFGAGGGEFLADGLGAEMGRLVWIRSRKSVGSAVAVCILDRALMGLRRKVRDVVTGSNALRLIVFEREILFMLM